MVSRNYNQNHLLTFTKIFNMKRILFIISLLSIISCNKQTPECDDKDVLLTVKDIILGRFHGGDSLQMANIEKSIKITNIRQSSRNEENKSCGCDATIELTQPDWFNRPYTRRNNYYYTAQKNTEGEIYVELFKQ